MAKIDAQGNVSDATMLDEDPDFPAEVQPVDEPRPVMESDPGDKQDERSAPKTSKSTTRKN